MKTPREMLLKRHQAASPKLDEIRSEIVNAEFKRVGQASRLSLTYLVPKMATGWKSVLWVVWDELVFPSRRLWTGLAAIWLVILAVNFSMRDGSQPAAERFVAQKPELVIPWQQQERLLAELIGPTETPAAEPQRPSFQQPRSERLNEFMMA